VCKTQAPGLQPGVISFVNIQNISLAGKRQGLSAKALKKP
jgi:hypothetical protein